MGAERRTVGSRGLGVGVEKGIDTWRGGQISALQFYAMLMEDNMLFFVGSVFLLFLFIHAEVKIIFCCCKELVG
jgi:hypothetical protein